MVEAANQTYKFVVSAKTEYDNVVKAINGGSGMAKKKEATWKWLLQGHKKVWISKKESDCRKPYQFKMNEKFDGPEGECCYQVNNDGSFDTWLGGYSGTAQYYSGQACHWEWTYFKEHDVWRPQVKSGGMGLVTGAVFDDW